MNPTLKTWQVGAITGILYSFATFIISFVDLGPNYWYGVFLANMPTVYVIDSIPLFPDLVFDNGYWIFIFNVIILSIAFETIALLYKTVKKMFKNQN
ncbi:hypothetical protein HOF56_03330 [Candidatus Peribacteria bacterium]|nr:hypothetical protein [Candidatus Peribacteria bacterium]MBT4021733.1 hypothetical protein [Candidatus Peribacteria bacterium]MBT4240606.1 hypothetical protein [Candidatus Peribacteria bacterium]MBT4474043.1 hypothetical protein [Candidatus Peribacteria bacterium]